MPYHAFKTPLLLEDAKGHMRSLRGCPINRLAELANLLQVLIDRTVATQWTTVAELWENDTFWRDVAESILELVALKAEWFTPAMLSELLLPGIGEDDVSVPSVIQQVCFPSASSDSKGESGSIDQYRIQQLMNLYNTQLADGMATALGLGDRLTFEEIDAMLAATTNSKSQQAHTPAQADPLADAKKLAEQMESGELSIGLPRGDIKGAKSLLNI